MHHEEPATYPLLSCVHGIARNCLLNLRQQRLGIADEQIANVLAELEFPPQYLDFDAKQGAWQLRKTSIEGAAIHGCEDAECAFAPDIRCLDRGPVVQNRQQ